MNRIVLSSGVARVLHRIKHALMIAALVIGIGTLFNIAKTQQLPAPNVDRVGFPKDYQSTFVKLYTFDNFQNRQIRVVWANPVAASVRPNIVYNFPYGSIILFESYTV